MSVDSRLTLSIGRNFDCAVAFLGSLWRNAIVGKAFVHVAVRQVTCSRSRETKPLLPYKFVSFHWMSESLFPVHQVEKQLTINTPFCVSICGHIPGVTPRNLLDDAFFKLFPEIHNVSQKSLFSRRLEPLAGDRLVDTFNIDTQVCMNT